MARQTEYFPFQGGLNTADPSLKLPPGELRDVRNYECAIRTGYRRIDGYERFSGKTKPSEESYWILNFTAGDNEPAAGDVVTGGTSSATGITLSVVVESGSWAGNDAAGYLVLRSVAGTFQSSETLTKSGPLTVGTSASVALSRGAATTELDTTYYQAAVEAARTAIAAVPGSGNILGVWVYKGVTYAFRNNAGDTETDMYKSSSSGWTKVALGGALAFDAGSAEISVGQTVTGATSTATLVVTYVQITSGTWSGGDAAGYLHYTTTTGTFQNNENLQVGGVTKAVANGVGVANTLVKDGVYEFVNYNFYGASASMAMYGVNGVNKGFTFDGTNFAFITTGMATDTPEHVIAHKHHLFFSFPGGSVQHSSIGEPLVWSVVTGAGEIALGDECVGMIVLPGEALGVFCRNRRFTLSGSSAIDWSLVAHNLSAGAVERTIQDMGFPVYLDDRGLCSFQQSDLYGDFAANTFSYKFQKVLDSRKRMLISTLRVREKSQYRLNFSDNSILAVAFDNEKILGATLFEYDDPIYCCCSAEDSDGNELLFGGSSDGYVYQLDKGPNFDGGAIEAWINPAFAHFKSPQNRKRFFKVVLDIAAESTCNLTFYPEYGYGDAYYPSDVQAVDVTTLGGGGSWDSMSNWDEFFWDANDVESAFGYISGIGENLSLLIKSVGTYESPHTLQGAILHFSTQGVIR